MNRNPLLTVMISYVIIKELVKGGEMRVATKQDRYNKKAYDSLLIRIPKGKAVELTAKANEAGLSRNGYIKKMLSI